MATAQDILDFWFSPNSRAHWFAADARFDELIRQRFATATEAAAAGSLDEWTQTPPGWLALLLLLDQFPRNLHRGDTRAWAQDVSAQRLALSGIQRGFDQALPSLQCMFAYLPLEHAENTALQQYSVDRFSALCARSAPEERMQFEEFLDYARRHREIIVRFGRFPHRNAVLGRANTAEEADYLAEPGSGF